MHLLLCLLVLVRPVHWVLGHGVQVLGRTIQESGMLLQGILLLLLLGLLLLGSANGILREVDDKLSESAASSAIIEDDLEEQLRGEASK